MAMVALVLCLVAGEAQAQAAHRFRITGNSTGVGWSWGIIKNHGLFCRGVVASGTVPNGGDCQALRDAFVNSMFLQCPQKIRVRPAENPCEFTITNLNNDEMQFWVGDEAGDPLSGCQVTNNPAGCSFNPLIEEVPAVPGLPAPALVAVSILLLGAGVFWMRRRRELPSA